MNRLWARMRQALALVGITLVFIGLAEIGARIYLGVRDSQPDYRAHSDAYAGQSWAEAYWREDQQAKLEWQPYVYWRHRPFQGSYVNVDRNGVRATYNVANANSARQVYFFGGSALWGTGVRDDHTSPSLVSKQLIEAGCRDVYVTNFGEIGYVSTQEVVTLMLALRQRQTPTLVVFYDGVNDTWSAFQNGQAGVPLNEFNRRAEFALEEGTGWQMMVLKQLGLYRLAEMVARRAATVTPQPVSEAAGLPQDVLSTFASNARLVQTLSAEYGFTPYYFWQPNVYSKAHLSAWEQAEAGKQPLGAREFFRKVYGELGTSGPGSVSRFENLSNAFDSIPETIYIDAWHPAERGNSIIAAAIARVIGKPLGCPS